MGRWLLISLGIIREDDPLAALVLSENHPAGPFPRTGGIVHAVSRVQARTLATLLRKYAPIYNVRLSLAASVARAEGDFDSEAIDPNDQDAKPGETPEQAALHADLGVEQQDVATAVGSFPGKSLAEIEATLRDPEYGVRYICSVTASNLAWARQQFAVDHSLVSLVPGGDPDVLGVTAYNKGRNGALRYARSDNPDWKYALSILSRAKAWAWLDAPPKETLTVNAPLNTHAVSASGIVLFVIGLLCYGPFQAAITKTLPMAANWLGIAFVVAGFAAAYLGRPATVPKGP